jgi:Tfp pilus assembly protein PilO
MINRFIIIGALFFLTVFSVVFLVWPGYQDLQVLQARVQEQETKLHNREQYFANLQDLEKKLADFSQETYAVQTILPNDPQIPSLLNEIQEVSSISGIVLESIKVSVQEPSSVQESKVKTINAIIEVVGSYEAFKQFLAGLYVLPRMVHIQDISFATPVEGTTFLFNVEIIAHSY